MGGMLRRCCCVPPQGTESCDDRFNIGDPLGLYYGDYFAGGIDAINSDDGSGVSAFDPFWPSWYVTGIGRWNHNPPRLEFPLAVPSILRDYVLFPEGYVAPRAPGSVSDWIGRRGFPLPEGSQDISYLLAFNFPSSVFLVPLGIQRFASTQHFLNSDASLIPQRGRIESEVRVRLTSATSNIISEVTDSQIFPYRVLNPADGPTDTYGIMHSVSLGFPFVHFRPDIQMDIHESLPWADWMSFTVFLFGNNWGNHEFTPLNSSLAGKACCLFQSRTGNVLYSLNDDDRFAYSSFNVFHVSDRDVGVGSHNIGINLQTNTDNSIFFSATHNGETFASSLISGSNMLAPQFWQPQPVTGCLTHQLASIVQPGWYFSEEPLFGSGWFGDTNFMRGHLEAGTFETNEPAFVFDYSRLQFQDVS